MNIVRRFFKSERGPRLWKWAALQTLFIWVIGAMLWFIYGEVTVATFAGLGMAFGMVGAFILFIASATRTFFVMSIAVIVDFLSFSVPLGISLAYYVGLLGGLMMFTGMVLLDYTIRRFGYGWYSPMWHFTKKEVDETGLPEEVLSLLRGSAKH